MTQAPVAASALPSVDASSVVVPAPGEGDGYWAGGPSAVYADGTFSLAYRLRRPVGAGRGYANVIAQSTDCPSLATSAVNDAVPVLEIDGTSW